MLRSLSVMSAVVAGWLMLGMGGTVEELQAAPFDKLQTEGLVETVQWRRCRWWNRECRARWGGGWRYRRCMARRGC
jgi:hypothetical protein